MTRRIVIEIDVEDSPDTLVKDITDVVMGHIDGNAEFKISQEVLMEKGPDKIQVPRFLHSREKGMEETACREDVVQNG